MNPKLYYFHDPMCSWCWGFKPTWNEIKSNLPDNVEVVNILGGLAPDSEIEMPKDMQHFLQQTWKRIESELNRPFNHAFWTQCKPRRSTYPACRAVIAASVQGMEQEMIDAIQEAYYLEARNPSDIDVLVDIAKSLTLDVNLFEEHMCSEALSSLLDEEISFYQKSCVRGFPSLMLVVGTTAYPLMIDYQDPRILLNQIEVLIPTA